eukprot:252646_1
MSWSLYWCLLNTIILAHVSCGAIVTNEGNVTCGDTIKDSFTSSDNKDSFHFYEFIINESVSVNFDTCNSNTDIVFVILENYTIVSDDYCKDGDWCGNCMEMPDTKYIENFTVPILYDKGKPYYIIVYYFEQGAYQIDIACGPYINLNPIDTVYVSKNGIDHDGCGRWGDECGTLYQASLRVDMIRTAGEIYVLDGQNETEIIGWSNLNRHNWTNPCVPYLDGSKITITFDPYTNLVLSDWYPKAVCPKNTSQTNRVLFYSYLGHITINNLAVTNYHVKDYNFDSFVVASIVKCNNCKFVDVIINSTSSYALIDTSGLVVQNAEFMNIRSTGNLIYNTWVVVIINSKFTNILTNDSLILLEFEYLFETGVNSMQIVNCSFNNIITGKSIINDNTPQQHIEIYNSTFDVVAGSIYLSYHSIGANTVNLNQISVTSYQINTFNKQALFVFAQSDEISLDNINITYQYDTYISCGSGSNWSDTRRCQNAVPFILNYGQVWMNNINLNVVYDHDYVLEPYTYWFKDYLSESVNINEVSLIQNHFFMKITNLYCIKIASSIFFANYGTLEISKMYFRSADAFNWISSLYIFFQTSSISNLRILHSHFQNFSMHYPSQKFIFAYHSTINLQNSKFERVDYLINSKECSDIVIRNCTLTNSVWGMIIHSTNSVLISESTFLCNGDLCNDYGAYTGPISSFVDNGLVKLKDNNFISSASLLFEGNQDTALIGNTFAEVNYEVISYKDNLGLNCWTGNSFDQYYLFYIEGTNITSCFRTQLIECLYNDNICKNGIYGTVDQTLSDYMGYFEFDEYEYMSYFEYKTDFPLLFELSNSVIA